MSINDSNSIHPFLQTKKRHLKINSSVLSSARCGATMWQLRLNLFELMMYMHHSQTHWSRDMNVNYRDLCVDLSKSPDIKPRFSASFSIVNSIFSPLCFSYSSLASCRNFLAT